MHNRHITARNRQLRAEMSQAGITIAPSPWVRLFVAPTEASGPARTLAFTPSPTAKARTRRDAS